ncbi:MAG: hypothetical protein K8I02_01975, partial [Candidatus Methylomirabilis sp.]|nr:hypothetical protein [Deltaproteobacteria bacterium]
RPDAVFDNLLRAEEAFRRLEAELPVGSRLRVGLYPHEFFIALHDRFTISGLADGFILGGAGTYSLSELLDRPEEVRVGVYEWILLAMTDYVALPDSLELQRRGYTAEVDRDFFALLERGAFDRDFRVARLPDLSFSLGTRPYRLRLLRVERIGAPMTRPPVTLP